MFAYDFTSISVFSNEKFIFTNNRLYLVRKIKEINLCLKFRISSELSEKESARVLV